MTFNEFKMCCILFCKTFEGKEYGEIYKGCCDCDRSLIIPKTPEFVRTGFFLCGSFIWYFSNMGRIVFCSIGIDSSLRFLNVKDFLNHFKIPLGDVV